MKTLLPLTLLLLSLTGMGQSDTGYIVPGRGVTVTGLSLTALHHDTMDWHTSYTLESIPYDTIPVILLVCDTADVPQYPGKLKEHVVYWVFGYEVREPYTYLGGPDTEPGQMMVHAVLVTHIGYNHICYLDKYKKRLGREIVVWDDKQIEI